MSQIIVTFATSFDINTLIVYVTTIMTYMITYIYEMTRRTNIIVVVKVVDLDVNHIYNHNHMVGWDQKNFMHMALQIFNHHHQVG